MCNPYLKILNCPTNELQTFDIRARTMIQWSPKKTCPRRTLRRRKQQAPRKIKRVLKRNNSTNAMTNPHGCGGLPLSCADIGGIPTTPGPSKPTLALSHTITPRSNLTTIDHRLTGQKIDKCPAQSVTARLQREHQTMLRQSCPRDQTCQISLNTTFIPWRRNSTSVREGTSHGNTPNFF